MEEHAEHRRLVTPAQPGYHCAPTMRGSGSSRTPKRSSTDCATRRASATSSAPASLLASRAARVMRVVIGLTFL